MFNLSGTMVTIENNSDEPKKLLDIIQEFRSEIIDSLDITTEAEIYYELFSNDYDDKIELSEDDIKKI